MEYKSHEHYMRRAYELAAKGYAEGGCPIGGVLVDNATGEILGEGHNALVQEGNPILHGEMAAMRAAGTKVNRHNATMYTTLQPCFMCTGTIFQFGIPRVVIGDVANASSDETIRFLRGKGIEVIVLDPATSKAAHDCVALVARFRQEKPELWLEDWGGGPNPALHSSVPPDDLRRSLVVARSNDPNLPHIGLVGDTYTILLAGKDTAGRFCLIDMHIPPGGGPPPHRHDFEESFILLEGEIEATFRGAKSLVREGETIHIPANAPHQFQNTTSQPARLLCICSPAGQEEFFVEVGVPVATRTTVSPKLDPAAQAEFKAKSEALAPKYRTELLQK